MKTRQIFKLKLLYLFNKRSIIIFIIVFVIILFCMIIEILNLDKHENDEVLIQEYINNSYNFIYILLSFLSMYLFSYSISFKNDFLVYLLIPLNVKKEKSLLISIILNILIILVLFLFIFISFSYLGLFISGFVVKYEIIKSLICILISAYIYGLYTMALMQILKNNFAIVVMMGLFILCSNIRFEKNVLSYLLYLILPILNDNYECIFNNWYLLILMIIIIVLNVLIYHYRDLNF